MIALLGLALGLQIAAASQKSYWEDEMWTASVAQNNPWQILQASASDVHPPLQYLAFSVWGRLFGFEEVGLRSLSILLIGVTLILSYRLASALFDSKTAIFTVILLSASPFFLTYGHNVRYYALSAALTLTAAFTTYEYHRSTKLVFLAGYALAGIALLYTIYMGLIAVLLCFLWGLFLLRVKKGPGRLLVLWLAAHIIMLAAFFPWLPVLVSIGNRQISLPTGVSSWMAAILQRIAYLGYSFSVGNTASPLSPVAWMGLALVAFLMLWIALNLRRIPMNVWVLIGFLSAYSAASILVSITAEYPVSAPQSIPNHIFYIYPFFLMLLAYVISHFENRKSWLAVGLYLVVGCFGIFNYFTGRQFLTPILNVPWREVMQELDAQAGPGAVMVCSGSDSSCAYYLSRFGFTPYLPQDWEEIASEKPPEVWWLQSNLGGYRPEEETEEAVLENLYRQYQTVAIENYALNDPSIRLLKAKYLQQEDYEYRLNVYKFSGP